MPTAGRSGTAAGDADGEQAAGPHRHHLAPVADLALGQVAGLAPVQQQGWLARSSLQLHIRSLRASFRGVCILANGPTPERGGGCQMPGLAINDPDADSAVMHG